MAIPPDPVEEVAHDATSAVVCEVVGVSPAPPASDARTVDADDEVDDEDDDNEEQLPAQNVLLIVKRVLFGKLAVGERVRATKPVGEYALRVGYVGPFLLDERASPAVILGRYGPDSYGVEEIVRARRARR